MTPPHVNLFGKYDLAGLCAGKENKPSIPHSSHLIIYLQPIHEPHYI
jgi:hypothetical protein